MESILVYSMTKQKVSDRLYTRDDRLEFTDDQAPFVWSWNKPVLIPFKHIIKVIAYYDNSTVYDTITVRKIL